MKKIILFALACTHLSAYAAAGPLSTDHNEQAPAVVTVQPSAARAPLSPAPYQSPLMRHRYEELLRLAAQDENVIIIDPRSIHLTASPDPQPDAAAMADMQ